MLQQVNRGGIELMMAEQLEEQGFLVAFSGRRGGTSVGGFSGLNLSYNVGDEPTAVGSNRRLLAASLRIPVARWVLPRQVHGTNVEEVDEDNAGCGAMDFASGIPDTDALVTGTGNIAIGVLTADCLPIIMVDVEHRAVAVAHAGWRGVLDGVAAAAAMKLASVHGSGTGGIYAFIGPHIKACCMEVEVTVAELFEMNFSGAVTHSPEEEKPFLDLETACRQQLAESGLSERNVFSTDLCTSCGPGYFSHRASGGACGRQGAFTAMTGGSGGG